MTIKEARHAFGVSTQILFEWVCDDTLELVEEKGNRSVKISETIPDSIVKIVDGVPLMTVGMMRELMHLWLQDRKEAVLRGRVARAVPVAALAGLGSTITISILTGHSIGSALAGALIGTLCFLCLIGRAFWMFCSRRSGPNDDDVPRKASLPSDGIESVTARSQHKISLCHNNKPTPCRVNCQS